jgi:Hint domain
MAEAWASTSTAPARSPTPAASGATKRASGCLQRAVVNAGTITSTGAAGGSNSTYAAVVFKSTGANRLVIDPGALFNGGVYASAGGSNTLELAAGSGTLGGFDTEFLHFQTIAVDAGAHWALTGTESVSSFEATETILIPQDASLTYNGTAVVCFCTGTLIGTPSGEIPVERLSVGDCVMTAHNGPRAVRWIGRGRVLATRGRRSAATPVIVRRGALADNVPNRDLHVHGYEASGNLRWTDGYATLPTVPFARFDGAMELVLTLAEATTYPDLGDVPGIAAA